MSELVHAGAPGAATQDGANNRFGPAPEARNGRRMAGRRLRPLGLKLTIAALDLFGMLLAGAVVFEMYGVPRGYDPAQLQVGLVLLPLAWVLSVQFGGLYRRDMLVLADEELGRVSGVWAMTFGCLMLLTFGLGLIGDFSRIWLIGWAVAALFWLLAVRAFWAWRLRHILATGHHFERAVVIGATEGDVERLAARIESGSERRIRVIACFDDAKLPGGLSCPEFLSELEALVRSSDIDRVYLAQRDLSGNLLSVLAGRLYGLAIDIAVVPDVSALRYVPVRAGMVGEIVVLDVATPPLTACQAFLKRAEDVILGTLLLVLLSPLFLAVVIAIRIDSPGPALFRQKRTGFRGQTLEVLKFRSMYHGVVPAGTLRQTARDDPRITRVGRFIRRTSIDELPQLVNVVRGDMSLVGPRPHATSMKVGDRDLYDLVADYAHRHRMKPGITGWAQVSGLRGEVHTREKLLARVQHDLHYIDNWSIWLDLRIIVRTALKMFFDRQAY